MRLVLTKQARFRDETAAVLDVIEAYFADQGTKITTGDETPNEGFEAMLPFVRADSVGGNDDGITDRPTVDIDVYASTRGEAKRIAEEIRELLRSTPHPIDSFRTLMRPQRVTWVEGVPVRRFYASYQLGLRR